MNNYPEKKAIRLSIITLLFAFLVIYTLLFNIKGDIFKSDKNNDIDNMQTTGNYIPTNKNILGKEIVQKPIVDFTGSISSGNNINTGINNSKTDGINPNTGFNTNKLDNQIDIYILSGTTKYNGPIKSIEKLGINYKYALKDSKDIYFIYLGDEKYNFADILRTLGGNLYTISTEKEIIENKLFGDKITYINIPEYKDKTVVMLVEIKGVQRLIQVEYTIYHQSKAYLQKLFQDY